MALFKPLKNNPEDADRICYVQTTSTWKDYEIGEESFGYFKAQAKQAIARQKLPKSNESAERHDDQVLKEDQTSNASEARVLGCFDDYATSLGYTITMNDMAETGSDIIKVKRVYSVLMMTVRGKLCYIYTEAKLRSDNDRLWAENTVKAWRKAILAVNPTEKITFKASSFTDEVEIYPLIGGVLGIAVSIFVILFQKMQKHRVALASLTFSLNGQSDPPSAGG